MLPHVLPCRLVALLAGLAGLFTLYHLYTTQCVSKWGPSNLVITSNLQHRTTVPSQQFASTHYAESASIFDTHKKLSPNDHIEVLLKCALKPNRVTNAIRLQQRILNISFIPQNSEYDPSQQYFNPTLIPLPTYSPYSYLLLSRLVTGGLHQESHICFATLCVPKNLTHSQAVPVGAHFCDESDLKVLGSRGGIRCATTPQRLNIPPTPAFRCQGAWAAFPDIPGFHDPRVFWSGKGEPLVIVNSASRYACVGLWVVDLRAVYGELEQLMERKGNYANLGTSGRGENHVIQLPARMSYPHLTELTRNPRESRGSIEKNWIIFFPKNEEAWVQYDLVAHGGHVKNSGEGEHHVDGSLQAAMNGRVGMATNGTVWNGTVTMNSFDLTVESKNIDLVVDLQATAAALATGTYEAASIEDEAAQHQHLKRSAVSNHIPTLSPSRTIAKLIGSGYTTSNLTSSDEAPCLSSGNLLDNLGRKGHWHQGSNSLRLILCPRVDTNCLGSSNESALVEDGKVVHFAILHRKFSNDLDLPMRYERYVMVWEARYPFRMIGISRHPLLFAGERAQPWSNHDNGLDADEEAFRWNGVYFTYTPSLAWSWRKESPMESMGGAKEGLGTGFLGDEVIVGIGMDDVAQGFARIKVEHLLSCLRLCPDFEGNRE